MCLTILFVHAKDSHWWLTIQCAASSFSSGTSNRAGLNSSSRAVGLLLGSHSRHFWINSYKNKHKGHTLTGKTSCIHKLDFQSLTQNLIRYDLSRYSWTCKHILHSLHLTLCKVSSSNCMALLMASWET